VTFVLPGSRCAELSSPDEAEFRMLRVHPGARGLGAGSVRCGLGAGRALTSWCIDRARAAGTRRLLLCSLPSMTSAHRIYLGLGFRRQPGLDFSPVPDVALLGFELPLRGGGPSTDTERPPVSGRRRPS
jgi:GNAT superfamily N-acetyltransferase